MTIIFLSGFITAAVIAFAATPLVSRYAIKRGIVDRPDNLRKLHSRPVPLLGGVAVYAGLVLGIAAIVFAFPGAFGAFIKPQYLLGIIAGCTFLLLGGYLDDKYRLPPKLSIIAPLLAASAVILSGVQLSYINNPLGGSIMLDNFKLAGYPVLGGIFIFLWILGMIYTTKFLDGMDGLVSGVTGIGAIVIFLLSQTPVVHQPDTALLAIIAAGAALGFLPWNFHPASIFLGESGSTITGFVLGVLAVISGGKIASALLIMGIPILDVAWVILRRLASNFSPFQADRRHLHFRLIDMGLSQRQTVIFLYVLSAAFGVSGLFLQSVGKLVALAILFLVMVALAGFLVAAYARKEGSRE